MANFRHETKKLQTPNTQKQLSGLELFKEMQGGKSKPKDRGWQTPHKPFKMKALLGKPETSKHRCCLNLVGGKPRPNSSKLFFTESLGFANYIMHVRLCLVDGVSHMRMKPRILVFGQMRAV